MIYYIEDMPSSCVLLTSNDRYLVTSLADGLFDVHIRAFTKTDATVMAITKHLNQSHTDTGIRVVNKALPELVPLNLYPEVSTKLQLIQIRKLAIENLMNVYQHITSLNTVGLGPLDIVSIQYALNNPKIIYDYANILKISEEFAQQELNMINDSILSEQFRIFSLCNYWKDTINASTTKEEIDNINTKIAKSFVRQGGIDD